MDIIHLSDISSTNAYVLQLLNAPVGSSPFRDGKEGIFLCDYQSAGKGMGTNKWESEAGKNLLFSILVHPSWLPASKQYLISMVQAVSLCEVLSEYTDGITIKWPNDIYWHDKKISGTLIEGNIQGRNMSNMVIGTGININQEIFLSDAPNPISLRNITATVHDKADILNRIITRFEHHQSTLKADLESGLEPSIIATYHNHLYRKEGLHEYQDKDGLFKASTVNVKPNGILVLKRENGTISEYEFKEVKFIL
ncbi:MAG: biotin--[acetyl-CoA-carboxylase] ligase [Prevotella sp.]|nr:biotin--[acetyl-CoA-carboxylase] ligase [Candidatus Prevotella equi]